LFEDRPETPFICI